MQIINLKDACVSATKRLCSHIRRITDIGEGTLRACCKLLNNKYKLVTRVGKVGYYWNCLRTLALTICRRARYCVYKV